MLVVRDVEAPIHIARDANGINLDDKKRVIN